jgi:hypothetical protein
MAEAVRAEVMAAAARTAYWTRSRPKDRFSEDLAVFGTLRTTSFEKSCFTRCVHTKVVNLLHGFL